MRNKSGTYTIEGIDEVQQYEQTIECLRGVNFSEEEIEQIWQIVVAVLILGNVDYNVDASNDTAHVKEECKPII